MVDMYSIMQNFFISSKKHDCFQSCSSSDTSIVTCKFIITAHFYNKRNYEKSPVFKMDIDSDMYFSVVQE